MYVVAAGTLVVVLSGLSLLRLSDAFDRLHVVTPATSLGAPLICAGLALNDQTLHGVFKYLFTGLLLAVLGPASAIAAARAARIRAGQDAP
jgi:multicomponent Na+:H+ antiporter subunit G